MGLRGGRRLSTRYSAGFAGRDAFPGASAHAATWLRLRVGQRWSRHSGVTGLSRPQEHPAHGALHRVGTGSVQGFLAIALVAASRPASAAFRRAAAELHYMVSPLVEPVEGLRALPYGAPINRDHAREHERKSKFCFEVGDKTRNPPRRGQPMK
jgi:hypothetical protein